MSALCTRIRSWPLLTVSPSRAWISTTRPEASEITGMLRETSGITEPVTFSSGAASYLPAVASGNLLGSSTLNRLGASVVLHLARAAALRPSDRLGLHLAVRSRVSKRPAASRNSSAGIDVTERSWTLHWMTSRPTARFSWLAAVR